MGVSGQDERLGKLLQMLRQREKLSQDELGCRIGLHRNVVWRLEHNPGMIRLATLRHWCAVLNEPLPKVLKFCENAPPEVNEDK